MRAGIRTVSLLVVFIAACVPATTTVKSSATSPSPSAAQRSARTPEPPTIATPTDAAGAPVVIVWMGDHYYSPSTLTVPIGTTVMWWMLGQQEHDVWAFDGSFHSPTLGPGSRFSYTFTTVGTFRYLCVPHSGDGMYGEVTVIPRPTG